MGCSSPSAGTYCRTATVAVAAAFMVLLSAPRSYFDFSSYLNVSLRSQKEFYEAAKPISTTQFAHQAVATDPESDLVESANSSSNAVNSVAEPSDRASESDLVVSTNSVDIAVNFADKPSGKAAEYNGIGIASIPLTLFQTDKARPKASYIEGWIKTNPGLKYVFMNDTEGSNYLRTSWSELHAEAFGSIKIGAIRADFLRLCYLAENGGFYADTDLCPGDKSLVELTKYGKGLIIPLQTIKTEEKVSKNIVWNAFLAATPKHPAMMRLVGSALTTILLRDADHIKRDRAHLMRGFKKNLEAGMAIAGPVLMVPLLIESTALVVYKYGKRNSASLNSDVGNHTDVVSQCIVGENLWRKNMRKNPNYWLTKIYNLGKYFYNCDTYQALLHGHAIDTKEHILNEGELLLLDEKRQLWAPSQCRMKIVDAQSSCQILSAAAIKRMLFVGDNVMRQLYLAFVLALAGNNFSLQAQSPGEPSDADGNGGGSLRDRCTNDNIFYAESGDSCRHNFARSIRIPTSCAHARARKLVGLHIEFVDGGGVLEAEESKHSQEQPLDLAIVSYGMSDNSNSTVVFDRIQRDVKSIRQLSRHPHVFWLASDARHGDDSATQINERVMRFNDDIFAQLKAYGMTDVIPINLFNVTLAMHSYDGTHYGPGVNHLKVQLLLHAVRDLLVSRRRLEEQA